jgi:hypothetical protein
MNIEMPDFEETRKRIESVMNPKMPEIDASFIEFKEDPVKYIKEMKDEIIELQNIQKDKSIAVKYPVIFMIVSNIISAILGGLVAKWLSK